MEKDLSDLMKDIKDFCNRYKCNMEVATYTLSIGGSHRVEVNIKKEE